MLNLLSVLTLLINCFFTLNNAKSVVSAEFANKLFRYDQFCYHCVDLDLSWEFHS